MERKRDPPGFDVTNLFRECDRDPEAFRHTLESMEPVTLSSHDSPPSEQPTSAIATASSPNSPITVQGGDGLKVEVFVNGRTADAVTVRDDETLVVMDTGRLASKKFRDSLRDTILEDRRDALAEATDHRQNE